MTSLPNVSDETLIQQFVQGDLVAFDSLYNRHIKAVYNRVRYTVPATDVEDVTQEVFIAAFGSLSKFRGEAQFGTWLRTLTNHKVAEYYRQRSRKKETMLVDLKHAEQLGDDFSARSLENMIALQTALNDLPGKYREIILLRLAEELPFNEIALCLEKNLEAVKSLFRRAISVLKTKMESNYSARL
jgi:RNA polymerase sigma-70 factor (ECF subfamily)